ncbi:MAG TPA: DEAD/DEAH box helicase [Candidatus Limnocylindrales bacterium]|nr:DEAD/DEAH box helicase [Candidatus Limnocylindrales bacterium]
MRFDQVLSRADDEVLEQLIGPPVVRLLNLLDPSLARPRRLRGLVTSFRPADELLRDPDARRELLDLLPPDIAETLAAVLGGHSPDAYAFLRNLRIPKGSHKERLIFDFFGVPPTPVDPIEQRPAIGESVCDYALFAHQRVAVRKAQLFLRSSPHRVLLHMPTGAGKTRTAMHLVANELRGREPCLTVWLAYSEELCDQAASEFEAAWKALGDRPIRIYRYWGTRSLSIPDVHDGFMVAGLGKTYATAKRDMDFIVRLADRASLVIIDEAHQAIAESYRLVLEVLVDRNPGSKLLGLTATPGRTWNDPDKDIELANFFHRNKVSLEVPGYPNPVDYLIDEGYLARPSFESLSYGGGPTLTTDDLAKLSESLDVPESVLEKLAEDDQRNLVIIAKVESLLAQHARVLVFAATVAHARLLATVLEARGKDAAAVTAATSANERHRLVTKFRSSTPTPMVLCNYGVLTTGFDAPRTSAAVIARPTKSLVLYSQMVGRATRGPKAGGNARATIITIVDTALPGFGRMSDAFMNWEDVW